MCGYFSMWLGTDYLCCCCTYQPTRPSTDDYVKSSGRALALAVAVPNLTTSRSTSLGVNGLFSPSGAYHYFFAREVLRWDNRVPSEHSFPEHPYETVGALAMIQA